MQENYFASLFAHGEVTFEVNFVGEQHVAGFYNFLRHKIKCNIHNLIFIWQLIEHNFARIKVTIRKTKIWRRLIQFIQIESLEQLLTCLMFSIRYIFKKIIICKLSFKFVHLISYINLFRNPHLAAPWESVDHFSVQET